MGFPSSLDDRRLFSRVILERCHLELRDFQIIVIIFFSLLGILYIDSSFCSKEEKTRCVFFCEPMLIICPSKFAELFFFIHCYYWGWEKWGHRSTYFHIHYFSLFSKCS